MEQRLLIVYVSYTALINCIGGRKAYEYKNRNY